MKRTMEIPITKDLRKFKTKDIGNFSFKEIGFIAVAIGAGVLCYKAFHASIDAAVAPMLIILAIGFLKPQGLSVPQYVRTVMKENLSPRTYINETDFIYQPDDFDELYGEHICLSSVWNEDGQNSGNSVNNKARLTKEQKKQLKLEKSRIIH